MSEPKFIQVETEDGKGEFWVNLNNVTTVRVIQWQNEDAIVIHCGTQIVQVSRKDTPRVKTIFDSLKQ